MNTSRSVLRTAALVVLTFACVAPVLLISMGCASVERGVVTAAVAADHPLASEAGAEILRRGGNAIDAAVATSFALSVVRPYSCGIGGGGFMVVHLEATEQSPAQDITLNYRETSPAAVAPDHFERLEDPSASRTGGHAAAVPGTVAGLLTALERWGTMDRDAVLAPAIRIAEQGFRVDANHVGVARSIGALFDRDARMRERFAFTYERMIGRGDMQIGDRVRLPEQARALRAIARDGAAAFYKGEIAEAMIRAIERDGGVMTRADLRGYTPREAPPLRASFAGLDLLAMPPPSSGGVASVQVMGMLAQLDALTPGQDPIEDPGSAHLLVESMKHAFADRARFLADPAFVDVPTGALIADAYLHDLASRVDPDRTRPPAAYGKAMQLPDDGGTSHLCVVDRWGNAVACTETINTEFGSLLPVPEYGFCLNNEMDDFTTGGDANSYGLMQSEANRPQPGKRPLSSMTPTIVLDDRGGVVAIAGASGGPRIITGTIQVLLRMVIAGQSATEAVERPRLHHQWSPDVLRVEGGVAVWDADWVASLEALGHDIGSIGGVGNVQAIRRGTNGWEAASDPRKGGRPVLLR